MNAFRKQTENNFWSTRSPPKYWYQIKFDKLTENFNAESPPASWKILHTALLFSNRSLEDIDDYLSVLLEPGVGLECRWLNKITKNDHFSRSIFGVKLVT